MAGLGTAKVRGSISMPGILVVTIITLLLVALVLVVKL